MKQFLCLLIAFFLAIHTILAQNEVADTTGKRKLPPVPKFFVGGAMDGGILSTATIAHTVTSINGAGVPVTVTNNTTGILRLSYFFNFGTTFNFNFDRHFGVYTGVDVKNIGFIEKDNAGQTVKRRTYNIGAPLGIKVGNMARRGHFLFLGGGIDAPVNYKEKSFAIRDQKQKLNEWFSERTQQIMPYVFAGASIYRSMTLKAQYYPGNFLNPGFTVNGTQPYAGYDVHLMMLSLGFVTHYGKKNDLVKQHVAELNTM